MPPRRATGQRKECIQVVLVTPSAPSLFLRQIQKQLREEGLCGSQSKDAGATVGKPRKQEAQAAVLTMSGQEAAGSECMLNAVAAQGLAW